MTKALLAAFILFACLTTSASGQQRLAFTYDAQARGPVPIPPSERGLQTVIAEPRFKVSHDPMVLQGPAFERNGDLLFCDVSGRRLLRLTPMVRAAF